MKKIIRITLSMILVMVMLITAVGFTSTTVKSIKLDKDRITLSVGQIYVLKATITPSDAGNKNMRFATSDKKIASVDKNGKITALKAGKVIITVSSYDRKVSVKCYVTISQQLFDKPVTLSLMTRSHPSYPYQENWYIYKLIEEKTNVKLKVEAYSENFGEKLQLKAAGGKMNDITYTSPDTAINFGKDGAFVDLLSNINKLPNFKKWKSNAKDTYLTYYLSPEKKLYSFPNEGMSDLNYDGFLYRKDIFEKYGINIPNDYNELYIALKKLKSIYPKSNPFVFRNKLDSILYRMTQQWGTSDSIYLNEKKDKFAYGPVEDNFKALIEYLAKLYREGLIPPDFMSLDTNGWQNLISTDNGFITVDNLFRIDYFNTAIRPSNPEFTLAYMKPPKGNVADGVAILPASVSLWGYSIASSSKKIDEALKLIDWMYSPEGADLTCWGEEGKTYKVVNGQRLFYIGGKPAKDILSVCKEYGLHTMGACLLIDASSETFGCSSSKEMSEGFRLVKGDSKIGPNIRLSEDESKEASALYESTYVYKTDSIARFIIGTRSMSEWDAYVKRLNDLGVPRYVEIYNNAYARSKK